MQKLLKQPTEEEYEQQDIFAERMNGIPKSFLREILKLVSKPDVISFAGGAPNPDYFPLKEIKDAAIRVLTEDGNSALQYSTSEGYYPLREFISDRYKIKGIDVSPEEILITNGSQQALDLIGKTLLNKGDGVLLESPSYLGAIQSLSVFQPEFHNAELISDGIKTEEIKSILWENKIKLFYTVPDFQNPTGISYSRKKRKAVADIIKKHHAIIVEDSPYEEIRFEGEHLPSFKSLLPEQTILLGSFSKTISPGLRLGWVACKKEFMEKLVVVKQAADLHSNFLSQKIIYSYLKNNDFEKHLQTIRQGYKKQRDTMIDAIKENFSPQIKFTTPSGGLFLWITLPEGCNAYTILEKAIMEGVAFVPGKTFFQNGKGDHTIRLSYSSCNEEQIRTGIFKLSKIFNNTINN